MAVAYDAGSESHTGTTGSTSEASFSWTHTPVGTPAGVLVFVFTISGTDKISSVTYGGVTMDRVPYGVGSNRGGEPGRIDTFFLNSGLGTGAKTVVVNRTNDTTIMYAIAATVTSGGTPTIYGPSLNVDGGSPLTLVARTVVDGFPGSNSLRLGAGFSGQATVAASGASGLTPASGATSVHLIAFGSYGAQVVYETTPSQGATTFGLTGNGVSDDHASVYLAVVDSNLAIPAHSVYGIGLETGDLSEYGAVASNHAVDNTTPHAGGAYSHKYSTTGTAVSTGCTRSIPIWPFADGDQVYLHFAYRLDTTSAPGADLPINFARVNNSLGVRITHLAADGKLAFAAINASGALATNAASLNVTPDTNWHYVEARFEHRDSGTFEIWHDGVSVASGTASDFYTANQGNAKQFTILAFPTASRANASYWVDDIVVAPWTGSRRGELQILARSPVTGTPNADAWTKSSGTTAWSLLNDTPFDPADFISTTSAGTVQTMLGGSFGSTQSGKGTGTIQSGSTVVSAWVEAVAKTSSTTGNDAYLGTRLRYGSTNYDTAIIAPFSGTTDTLVRGSHLTPAAADLSSYEVGVHSELGTHTRTVEDIWAMAIHVVPAAGGNATLNKTLGALTSTGAVKVLAKASLSKTLGTLTLAATATAPASGATATLNKTLGALTSSGTVKVLAKASLSKTLGALTSAGTVKVLNRATLNKTLGALTSTGSIVGGVVANATLNKTLGALTSSGTIKVLNRAVVNDPLGALTSTGTVKVLNSAVVNDPLGALTSSGTIKVLNRATLAKTLGTLTLAATATIAQQRFANLNQTLGALTSTGTARVTVKAALVKTLGPLTGAAVAKVIAKANLNKTLGPLTLSGLIGQLLPRQAQLNATLGALMASGSIRVLGVAEVLPDSDVWVPQPPSSLAWADSAPASNAWVDVPPTYN